MRTALKNIRKSSDRKPAKAPVHKYAVGLRVRLLRRALTATQAEQGPYTIMRQMPADRDVPVYRVKSESENYERVATETQLEAIASADPAP